MLHPKLQAGERGAGEENVPYAAVFNSNNKTSLRMSNYLRSQPKTNSQCNELIQLLRNTVLK